jgi:hypothetical protein
MLNDKTVADVSADRSAFVMRFMFFWFHCLSLYIRLHVMYAFNFVNYVFLLCLCIIVMYVLFCILCFHRANWHSSAILTDVFPCFLLSCKANARV